ncbi:interleukin-6 receptor subunit alpha-like isoform X2 [Alosa sapidissima]|uniref:interleukin-6 receptor subunit alpha-like isoform X2 n=1 Tax=Alosa sapidissima TaxID=34773 RepID=UPI001C09C014|nr:interleukin-6 receptor subunit alpha-like isoform X2 [Alosa sapidissima]
MLLWVGALVLLVLVEGYRDNMCPRRDPARGVLVLSPGSEVLLHCHGDVIVDRVLKVRGKSERPFIGAYQQNTRTSSNEGHRMQTAESSTVTYQTETVRLTYHEGTSDGTSDRTSDGTSDRTSDGTSHEEYQEEGVVTPTGGHYDKNRTTSGAHQRETGRTSTEGFRRETSGTSSVGNDEHTDGTLPEEHERETGVPVPSVNQEEAVSARSHLSSSNHEKAVSARPHASSSNQEEAVSARPHASSSNQEDAVSARPHASSSNQEEAVSARPHASSSNQEEAVSARPHASSSNQEEAVSARPHVSSSTSGVGSTVVAKPPLQDDVTAEGGAVALERRSYWTRNGVLVQGSTGMSPLTLPHFGLMDVGNYSCYRQGALMSSVNITLGTPPVRPTLSCYRRSPGSNIRCDWTSPQPVVPIPKCYILLEKSRRASVVKCSYSVLYSRCWCVLEAVGMDRSVYAARLCVTNAAGNATSPEVRFTAENAIKPDPPASVRVSGVEGGERMLGVAWSYPASWRRGFYLLRFQLKYRPTQREKYQTVETEAQSWTITDALPHTDYELQLRAREEFSIGHWSDWSPPVYSRTWTAVLELTTPSQDPVWIEEGSGSGEDIMTDAAVSEDSFDMFGSVFGVCVLAGMVILLSVYVFRHRMRFASTLGKLGSASASAAPPAARPQPPALEEDKPLMSPVSPTPSQFTLQHQLPPVQEDSGQNVHFHNMGYFLVPKE